MQQFNYSLLAVFAVAAVLISCENNPGEEIIVDDENKIILTVDNFLEVEFSITGESSCRINWGDGSDIEEHKLTILRNDHFQHLYLMDSRHTITITGNDITSLNIGGSAFTYLDVSNNPALISLDVHDTYIPYLNVKKNTSLMALDCNNNLYLANLELSNNVALQELHCAYNRQFTALDVNHNVELTVLNCFGNELAELDVSNNTALEYLDCSFNNLTVLNVSKNSDLKQLHCHTNQIQELDVSQNVQLTLLICGNNLLTQLDMSENPLLEHLDCSYNRLEAVALNDLFETLPSNTLPKYINISHNPGALQCRRINAENKGWWVYDGSGVIVSSVR